MLLAVPFDLCLFTNAGILPAGDLDSQQIHVRELFRWSSEQFIKTNQRLSKNSALQGCQLALPMTKELFDTLRDTPSWQASSGRAALRLHKASVLRFLMSNNQYGGSPILHLTQDNTHLYIILGPADFFAPELPTALQAAWTESGGACVFGNAQTLEPAEAADISACWVISPGRGRRPNQIEIQAQSMEAREANETREVPMLSTPFTCPDEIEQIDFWPWERLVRQALWQNEPLPFQGPLGPFGFRPTRNSGWQPGQPAPSAPGAVHGYLDYFGGIWQWEGSRASRHTPFDGHWNVQLMNGHSQTAWENHLRENGFPFSKWTLHGNEQPHVNIEPDGNLWDFTFTVV
jgi:hypothetical protein